MTLSDPIWLRGRGNCFCDDMGNIFRFNRTKKLVRSLLLLIHLIQMPSTPQIQRFMRGFLFKSWALTAGQYAMKAALTMNRMAKNVIITGCWTHLSKGCLWLRDLYKGQLAMNNLKWVYEGVLDDQEAYA